MGVYFFYCEKTHTIQNILLLSSSVFSQQNSSEYFACFTFEENKCSKTHGVGQRYLRDISQRLVTTPKLIVFRSILRDHPVAALFLSPLKCERYYTASVLQ